MLRAHSRPSPRKPNHGHHLLYHQAICPQSRRHGTRKKQNQCQCQRQRQRQQNNKKSSYSRK